MYFIVLFNSFCSSFQTLFAEVRRNCDTLPLHTQFGLTLTGFIAEVDVASERFEPRKIRIHYFEIEILVEI